MTAYAFRPMPPFRPHRLLPGGHLQTVVGCYLPQAAAAHDSAVLHVPLDDGDMLALHEQTPPDWRPGDPVALLVHGLGGASDSPYMIRKADRLCEAGVRSYRLDLRGCGAGVEIAKKACHAGCSHDCLAALDFLAQQCPGSSISLIGFSMGGNIVLKLAGELGHEVPFYLKHVIAVAPPIDLATCCENMQRGWNWLYDWSFVNSLNKLVAQRIELAPEAEHIILPKPPRRLREFDQKITAPLCGFASADEYYRLSSAAPLLAEVRVPTLIIAADDDPVIPVEIFEQWELSPQIHLHITRSGGHLGYVAASGSDDPDWRWLDWRLIEQVQGSGQQEARHMQAEPTAQQSMRAGIAAMHGLSS